LKIAFDQQIFLLQEYGGISRYVCELQKSLAKFENVDSEIFAYLHTNKNLKYRKVRSKYNFYFSPGNFIKNKIIQYVSPRLSRLAMQKFKPKIIHETYYSAEPFKIKNAYNVLTVYDMIHELYSQEFQNSRKTTDPKKAAAYRADHIICISDNTRRELINIFGLSQNNISVVHLGVDATFWAEPSVIIREIFNRPFLLFVGKREGYKNFNFFLRAFASSRLLMSEFDIVCFGGGLFTECELTMAKSLGLQPNQLRNRSGADTELRGLYHHAHALVYPSLHEGFGLPPLEAMAAQCPVIVSNQSSLPEIVGDAGQYFDPNDIESARSAIELVLTSKKISQQLIELGKQRCRQFTWEKCATETLEIYNRLN